MHAAMCSIVGHWNVGTDKSNLHLINECAFPRWCISSCPFSLIRIGNKLRMVLDEFKWQRIIQNQNTAFKGTSL